MKNKYLKINCLILLSLLFFFSCADTTPVILSVHYSLVYDYASETSEPQKRLSVFVSPDTESTRFSELLIQHMESNMSWSIKNPTIITSGSKEFIGCPNLMPNIDGDFPLGEYKLIYTDVASRSVESKFTLKPIPSFEKNPPTASNYKSIVEKKIAKEFIFDRVALYDENDELIYYGGQKRDLLKLEEIRKNYPDARKMRRYRMRNDNSCGILFAPIDVPEYIDNTAISDAEEE